jgi:hypothetical protein
MTCSLVCEPGTLALYRQAGTWVSISVRDADGLPMDPVRIEVDLTSLSGTSAWTAPEVFGSSSRLTRTGIGDYHFALNADEVNGIGDRIAVWRIDPGAGLEPVISAPTVRVIGLRFYTLVQRLREFIDKAQKAACGDCLLGYSPWLLSQFLIQGLSYFNVSAPSSVRFGSVDSFPLDSDGLLVEIAMAEGLTAQSIFAIDTTLPFNAQGSSFSIDRHPQIEGIVNRIRTGLPDRIKSMKMRFLGMPTIHMETTSAWRAYMFAPMASGLFVPVLRGDGTNLV